MNELVVKDFVDRYRGDILSRLPKYINEAEFFNLCYAIQRDRKLMDIARQNPDSLLDAICKAAECGLLPGNAFGHCWLIGYGGKEPAVQLQVGYIGNKQVHGTVSNAISSTPLLPFLSRAPGRDQATINALGQVVANPFAGLLPGTSLNGSTISVATLLQAFPEFSGVTQSNSNPGWGTFNELSVMLQKRFSKGLQATVNYQHSRQLSSFQ